jgi:hypothetical protein
MKILRDRLARGWYPGEAGEMRALAEGWEGRCGGEARGGANVVVLPHAGWGYSGETAWRAVRELRGGKFKRVVVLAPLHRVWAENVLVAPEAGAVRTPLGEIPVDGEAVGELSLVAPVARDDGAHEGEHAAQIEYPLLQLALGEGFKVVPLLVGGMGADQMGMASRGVAKLAGDGETAVVVSSDFTHYGADFDYAPWGTRDAAEARRRAEERDLEAWGYAERGDAEGFREFVRRTGTTICGAVPLELLLRALPEGTRLARTGYAQSGPEESARFVCYLSAAGRAEWAKGEAGALDGEAREWLLRLARESVERAVRGEARPGTEGAPEAAMRRMGAFVTLTRRSDGELRGCIGEMLPRRPLAEAVAARAADAALRDPRFPPVRERELEGLRVEVSALSPPEAVGSWREIVLGRDGMTLEKDGRFAVFLPQVAPEQGWDLATTLEALSRKAGLPPDAWQEGARFETFRAEVFHER